MKRTSEYSKMTKTELTALARRKKIPVTSGMLKNELVKTIQKGLRKIEAQKKSKAAKIKTGKRTATSKKKSSKTSKAKTTRKTKAAAKRATPAAKKAVRKKSPVKTKKTPAKKSASRKPKTSRPAQTVKSKPAPEHRETHSDLPARYGDHRLVVMARDPNWAYAYWELTPARVSDLSHSAKQAGGPPRWVLRVYSAALHPVEEKGHYFDIDIDVKPGSHYINLSRPGARFIVAIGVVDASGIFRTAAESNPVIMPLDHPSEAAVFPIALK